MKKLTPQTLFLGSVLFLTGIMIILLLQISRLTSLLNQPLLVQLNSGHTIPTTIVSGDNRSPESVQAFVQDVFLALFSWSANSTVPGSPDVIDPGVVVNTEEGERRLPIRVWQASFALRTGFDEAFRQALALEYPANFFARNLQSSLVIDHISTPKLLKSNIWQVELVGQIKLFDETGTAISAERLVRKITVQSTNLPITPTGETALEKAIYAARLKGLFITDISALEVVS